MAHYAPTRIRTKPKQKNNETKIDNVNCRRRTSAWRLRNRANANANRENANRSNRASAWSRRTTRKGRTTGRSVREIKREIEPHRRSKGKGAADLRSGQTGTQRHETGYDAEN